jgi:hypothetical protein
VAVFIVSNISLVTFTGDQPEGRHVLSSTWSNVYIYPKETGFLWRNHLDLRSCSAAESKMCIVKQQHQGMKLFDFEFSGKELIGGFHCNVANEEARGVVLYPKPE